MVMLASPVKKTVCHSQYNSYVQKAKHTERVKLKYCKNYAQKILKQYNKDLIAILKIKCDHCFKDGEINLIS
jgi:hypothetical protein